MQAARRRAFQGHAEPFGWDRWLGERGGFVGMTGFAASSPAEVLYRYFGITPEAIVAEALRLLATQPETATT